jgi:hypothetical protein
LYVKNKYNKMVHKTYMFLLGIHFFLRWVLKIFRESYVKTFLRPRFLLRNHYLYFEANATAPDDLNAPDLILETPRSPLYGSFLACLNFGLGLETLGPTPFWPTIHLFLFEHYAFNFDEHYRKFWWSNQLAKVLIEATIRFKILTVLS